MHNTLQQMCVFVGIVAQQTVEAWRSVFCISAGIFAFSIIFYGLFGSGELQSWATPKDHDVELTVTTVYGTEQGNSRHWTETTCQFYLRNKTFVIMLSYGLSSKARADITGHVSWALAFRLLYVEFRVIRQYLQPSRQGQYLVTAKSVILYLLYYFIAARSMLAAAISYFVVAQKWH